MRKTENSFFVLVSVFVLATALAGLCFHQKETDTWPHRVLVTNDDGIESPGIIELARAFSQVAETYVVAPDRNRSGSTHFMSAMKKGALKVKKRSIGKNIKAYAVDGFPADCVLVALGGIMQDNLPDIVISGINDGPNYSDAWIGSGTIGAARVASYNGFPAIAVSGVDDKNPGALEAASRWIVRLTQSPFFHKLGKKQFLTVDIPNVPPSEIKGIRPAKRAELHATPVFQKSGDSTGEGQEIWRMAGRKEPSKAIPDDSDYSLFMEGHIVIVPMKADENDCKILAELQQNLSLLPPWAK